MSKDKTYYFLIAEHGDQSSDKVKDLFESLCQEFESNEDNAFVFDTSEYKYYGILIKATEDEDNPMPLIITAAITDEEDESIVEAMGYESSPRSVEKPFVFFGELDSGASYCMLAADDGKDEDGMEQVKYVSAPFNLGWSKEGVSPVNDSEKIVRKFKGQFEYIKMLTNTLSVVAAFLG